MVCGRVRSEMIKYFQKEGRLLVHEILLVGVLAIVTGVRLLTGVWELDLLIAWWWLGAVIGFVFVFLDRIVYAFWLRPEEVLSMKMRDLMTQGKMWQGLAVLLQERDEQERLIIRSALFLIVWLVLALFAVFSIGGGFGRGFMFGLGIHLVTDLIKDYLGKGRDMSLWFWQIKREIGQQERQAIVWGFTILAVMMLLGL